MKTERNAHVHHRSIVPSDAAPSTVGMMTARETIPDECSLHVALYPEEVSGCYRIEYIPVKVLM